MAHDVPVFQKDDLPGVGQEGRDVRGYEMLARADAENERRGHAGRQQGVGIVPIHEADGIGPVRLPQRGGKGLEQIRLALAAFGDEIDQHFGIRLRMEDIALAEQIRLDLLEILDDAVMASLPSLLRWGCALRSAGSPCVAQRVCPMAVVARVTGSCASFSSSAASLPLARMTSSPPLRPKATPAES